MTKEADDTAGPLLGWSLNSVADPEVRPFDKLTFPTEFRFKAIGLADDSIVSTLLGHVAKVLGRPVVEGEWSLKHTSSGKYVSLTLELQVTSGQQIYDIYDALRADQRVTHLL